MKIEVQSLIIIVYLIRINMITLKENSIFSLRFDTFTFIDFLVLMHLSRHLIRIEVQISIIIVYLIHINIIKLDLDILVSPPVRSDHAPK